MITPEEQPDSAPLSQSEDAPKAMDQRPTCFPGWETCEKNSAVAAGERRGGQEE